LNDNEQEHAADSERKHNCESSEKHDEFTGKIGQVLLPPDLASFEDSTSVQSALVKDSPPEKFWRTATQLAQGITPIICAGLRGNLVNGSEVHNLCQSRSYCKLSKLLV
jgi:hypothetical protein